MDARNLGAALREHLAGSGLPLDSGVSQRWIWVRFLGIPVVFPNFEARRAVLVTHDVHHLLTGYRTDWRGEAEIGGFEIASGCKHLWAAWFFNFGGFLFGLAIAPRRTFAAFVRGRRCTNFYGEDTQRMLARTVDGARRELGLDLEMGPATARDGLAFLGWVVVVAVAYVIAPLLLVWLLACLL
ncbi:MAG TPA: hypothetical protein VFD82_04105 [Planctomycetota bacterium]|nr:hypothetical protein [Planctomycetota bacterium]